MFALCSGILNTDWPNRSVVIKGQIFKLKVITAMPAAWDLFDFMKKGTCIISLWV